MATCRPNLVERGDNCKHLNTGFCCITSEQRGCQLLGYITAPHDKKNIGALEGLYNEISWDWFEIKITDFLKNQIQEMKVIFKIRIGII